MQTFLPYPNFIQSFHCLDYRRLGKQRVEAKQILKALGAYPVELMNPGEKPASKGWANHPATKMWEGHENALAIYHNLCIVEWIGRGYKNNMPYLSTKPLVLPPWMGKEEFHAAHRSNLLRKDLEYYSQFGWTEPDDLEYVWPV